MLTFYFAPYSTASITQAVLAELRTPHEAKLTPLGPEGTKSADFLKINPNGRVPVIVHDGTVIWESAAITMYLGEAFGVEAKLYPAMGPKRGEAMKWIVWSTTCVAEAGSRLITAVQSGNPGGLEEGSQDSDRAKVLAIEEKRARQDLDTYFRVLDAAVEHQPFLLGNEYSLADTHLGSVCGWLTMLNVDMAGLPHAQAWMKSLMNLPAFKR